MSGDQVVATRACGWCGQAMVRRRSSPDEAEQMRANAVYCSQRCRQAAHRFYGPSRRAGAAARVAEVRGDSLQARRFAYADPPYPGTARRYYGGHPDFGGEVDHAELITRLSAEYDGWALSTSAIALPGVLALCPAGSRVAAWFRGERPTASYSPLTAWEPVIYFGCRRVLSSRGSARRLDALVYRAAARRTDPRRVIGAKPAAFCAWLFELLGARPGDGFVDLFPGSGGVRRAWQAYCAAAAEPSSLDHTTTPRSATA